MNQVNMKLLLSLQQESDFDQNCLFNMFGYKIANQTGRQKQSRCSAKTGNV